MNKDSTKKDWAFEWLKKEKRNFIGDSWVKGSGENFQTINPANSEPLCELSFAGKKELDQAVSTAEEAFRNPAWASKTPKERGRILLEMASIVREHQEEIATLETLDNGKIFAEAYDDDVAEAADIFEFYAGFTNKYYGSTIPVGDQFLNYTEREALGVCALIVPWNFPFLLACWKIAPCLAAGNTAIVKPAPFTSLGTIRFFEILQERKLLPPGVLNLLLGHRELGEIISMHESIQKISFTGSTVVGKKVVESSGKSNLKSVTLELGGKSPNIIFEDVPDIDFSMDRSYYAMFCHKGEKCSEPTRLFVHEKHYKKVCDFLKKKAESIKLGDPFDPKSEQGPQCHKEHFEKVMNYIEIGKKEGANLLAGGERDTSKGNENGYYVRPTVFSDVDNRSRLAQEEIFGPVLAVTPFSSDEEVVAMANDTTYGLAAGLWTSNINRALKVSRALDAGMVFVNRYGCYDHASPFGGFKQSGWGKEFGVHGIEAYTKLKNTWVYLG